MRGIDKFSLFSNRSEPIIYTHWRKGVQRLRYKCETQQNRNPTGVKLEYSWNNSPKESKTGEFHINKYYEKYQNQLSPKGVKLENL
mgnify:CR=1 FL=1